MPTKFGTKDLMRIEDIRKRGNNDFIEEVKLAIRMAEEIELAGKALARGYAAVVVYQSYYSPIASIFFERACKLSGKTNIEDIQSMASMNSVNDDEAIEKAYSQIPEDKQPASRRNERQEIAVISNKTAFFDLISLAKINVVKGKGPNFDAHYNKTGTIEVWKTSNEKIRIIYTGSSLPTAYIGDERDFKFDGKREKWEMVDYIEVGNMTNLMPLYGTSITGFMYN